MRELIARTEIDAPPELVWAVLTDFGAYPEWNPFIKRIIGEPTLGSRLEVTIAPPGGRVMTFKPTVHALEPRREIAWLGRLLAPGLFDGEHHLQIASLPSGGTSFTQSERFSGILVPLTGGILKKT